ncbi:hypothetical protein KAFR_0E01910 [Kazachstania africana CBS 2517]|uniref:GPI mannosyltransferase 1 n=1 Tax=Kazachstania africana (strain ATCC 22294 / BCRC 22015 / CBS 2517 / CECT 1963 / NBRC 1671 / NRRL Y-8276) TaxID=1071382 RepID=H2AVE5_KAZAF|nr:hypothetical protein KAFR_0E01910 [Kazachstania africana CBS 2517]CCF58345.1 hypothetical protein KAFR_0E01910 [Kazachstania africana CBS 2517]
MLRSSQKKNVIWLILVSVAVRIVVFMFGLYQDAHFKVKFTDIDYNVVNDAANYVYQGQSPYLRDTYRYTPLLSWIVSLNQTVGWFHFSKLIFILCDILTGLILLKLVNYNLTLGSCWLLNPMVITISTRGNAESLLCFIIVLFLLLFERGYDVLGAIIFGLSIHLKIYPIIFALPITVYLYRTRKRATVKIFLVGLMTLLTIVALTLVMYNKYGYQFLDQTYLYHLYRSDHRHNFSIWNLLLYYDSAGTTDSMIAKFAFLPQLIVVTLIGAYSLWLPNNTVTTSQTNFEMLINVIFLQIFAFVTFNKVITSQYFIWFLNFIPIIVQNTTISPLRWAIIIATWFVTQALWLSNGYKLEFLGQNVFYPGLFLGNVCFFMGNVWILGQFINDVKNKFTITLENSKKIQ